VVYHRGALYLVARDASQGRVKHYKVDRIAGVEVLAEGFDRPRGFDLAAHMAPAFGVYRGGEPIGVKVRFTPTAARYVREARRHESQRLTPLPDGGVLAEFTVSGTEEIKSWILGFGAKAVVIEPEGLRAEIVEELRAMASHYVHPPDGSPGG
jgi:predicted DNA-binding transcriptional regulator YafY